MTLRILVERGGRRTFASALDLPGLSRGGRDEATALEALRVALPRFASIAAAAGESLDPGVRLEVVERLPGDATTDFGAPSVVAAADAVPTDGPSAQRLVRFLRAAWSELDVAAAAAPEALRKGPRGGGRDRTPLLAHVDEAEAAYAATIGIPAAERRTRAAQREAIAALLGAPSDGAPLAGKRWPARYAARRIAWHVVDHRWELQDRSGGPGGTGEG